MFNYKKFLLSGLIITMFLIFLVSLYQVLIYLKEKKDNYRILKNINNLVEIKEIINLDNTSNLNENLKDVDYYKYYQTISYLSVDFLKLKEINHDVTGFLSVAGTTVNYPYVKTNDNSFYLTHSFDKNKNASGWVFLDYRNDIEFFDKNTIIYAHGGNSFSMFGPLKELYDSKTWYSDSNNHFIKIATSTNNYIFKVFSIYKIKTTSDYLKINFQNDLSYQIFLDKIKNRTYYDFYEDVSVNDKIITLSTCYNKKEKLVIHAKLISKLNK